MGRAQALLDLLLSRMAEDEVPEQTGEIILAAYGGDEPLRAVLAGEDVRLPKRRTAGDDVPHVYLETVTVAGFRTIGHG